MPEQRVSDERLVRLTRPGNVVELLLEEAREFHNVWRELALDLRDARNEIARLNELLGEAIEWFDANAVENADGTGNEEMHMLIHLRTFLGQPTPQDERAERLAQVEPVVRAAVKFWLSVDDDLAVEYEQLGDTVNALPESVRPYYGTPPIDWDAPVEPPAPVKDGAE